MRMRKVVILWSCCLFRSREVFCFWSSWLFGMRIEGLKVRCLVRVVLVLIGVGLELVVMSPRDPSHLSSAWSL